MNQKPLKYLKESEYNVYSGMNICNIRSQNLFEYYPYIEYSLQELYDIGCSLVDLNIVKQKLIRKKKSNLSSRKYKLKKKKTYVWMLNKKFGDYDSWKNYQHILKKNCYFLQLFGHPKLIG